MTNERLQELLNIILFADEITTETDNAHIEIVEAFDDFEEEKLKLANKLLDLSVKYSDSVDNAIELKSIVDDFESRTCESCKWLENKRYCSIIDGLVASDFCCKLWEAKDAN